MSAIISVNQIFKAYKDLQVLKGVDITIQEGEIISIVGASGAGKTTLLQLIGTLDNPDSGNINFLDTNVNALSKKELARFRNKNIGFVFQFHYLLSEFTVLENVMLPAKKLGRKSLEEVEHDAYEKLILLGIEDQALKLASRISGGQKQRVAISRALINDPIIVMGDEPTGNLDSKNSENVFRIFKELSEEQGLSLLVVTHDADFADRTDRIIHMEDGKIIQV